MTIQELISRLGFEIDDKQLKQFNKGIADTKKGMLGLISLTGAAVGAMGLLLRTSANSADQLNRQALAAGTSVESLQRLGFAASQSGSSTDELARSMQFLNRNVYNALRTGTGTQAEAFQKLGISMSRLKNATPEQLILDISKKMQGMTNASEKSALSMEVFGRAGTGLLEFLNQGPESIQRLMDRTDAFGVVTQDQVMVLKSFNDALGAIFFIFNQLRNIVAAKIAPEMIKLIRQFEDFLVVNADIIKEGLIGFFQGLGSFIKVVVQVSLSLARVFLFLASRIGNVERITKILLFGLAAISSLFLIKGIVAMAMAFKGLFAAITLVNIAALKIPLLIGAAIALVILVIDDLVAFFTGGDSVTELIIEKFREAFNWVANKANEFLNYITERFMAFGNSIASFFTSALQPVVDLFTWISDRLNAIPSRLFGNASAFAKEGTVSGATPQASQIVRNGGSTQNNIEVNSPITITLPEGVSSSEAATRIENGVDSALQDALSNLGRANARSLAF